MLVVKALLH